MKKSYILIPILLFIYTIVMAVYGWDKFPGGRAEFITIVGANIGIIILLFFLLRRRSKFRNEMREANKRFAAEKADKKNEAEKNVE